MKKTIAFLVLLSLLFGLCACTDKDGLSEGEAQSDAGGTDLVMHYDAGSSAWVDAVNTGLAAFDWTGFDTTELLTATGDIAANKEKYDGQLLALAGTFAAQELSAGGMYYYIAGVDATACCSWSMELLFNEATEIPANNAEIVILGKFGSYVDKYDSNTYDCVFVDQLALSGAAGTPSSEAADAPSSEDATQVDPATLTAEVFVPTGDSYTLQDGRIVTVASGGSFGKGVSAVVTTLDMSSIKYNYAAIINEYMVSNMQNLHTYPGIYYGLELCFKGTYHLADGIATISAADEDGTNAWQMELLFNDATEPPADGATVSLIGTLGSYKGADDANRYAVCVEQLLIEG